MSHVVALAPSPLPALLRAGDVARYLGVPRPSVYRLMRVAGLPAPVRLHGRSVAWRRDELDQWIADRPRSVGSTEHDNAPAVAAEASISAHA